MNDHDERLRLEAENRRHKDNAHILSVFVVVLWIGAMLFGLLRAFSGVDNPRQATPEQERAFILEQAARIQQGR